MANISTSYPVLADMFGPCEGVSLWAKRAALVIVGIALLAVAAKIRVPMWPVPMTMGTLAVLCIGATYGARLGLATVLGYLLLGAVGLDVFAGSGAGNAGLGYMMGGTGGYLLGYVLAAGVLGALAARGWDRTAGSMTLALLIGNVLIYVPGLLWLGHLYGWEQPILQWGLTPFLLGDAVKLALAALLVPGLWRLLGRTRG